MPQRPVRKNFALLGPALSTAAKAAETMYVRQKVAPLFKTGVQTPAQAALARRPVSAPGQPLQYPAPTTTAQEVRASPYGPAIGSGKIPAAPRVQVGLIDPNAFVSALAEARQKAGGVNRLACYLMQRTGEPLEQKTIHNWLKGLHLPRQDRMARIFALLTAV